jgi:tripartite-type tricarboxylate transporter receptor subunit TctC
MENPLALFAKPGTPFKDANDMIAYAKANPGN